MSKLSYSSSDKIENIDRFPNRNQYSIKNLEQEYYSYIISISIIHISPYLSDEYNTQW